MSRKPSLPKRLLFIFLATGCFLILPEKGNSQESIPDSNKKVDRFILLEIEKSFGITFVFLKENELHKEFLVEALLTGKEYDLSWEIHSLNLII